MKWSVIFLLMGGLLVSGCKDDDDSPAPLAAQLVFPEENSECTDGVSLNATQSSVTFMWEPARYADTYQLTVTNLTDGSAQQFSAGTATSVAVTLLKATPYSWRVTSFSGKSSKTAQSPLWSFYNAGEGIISHIPFPASALYPVQGATVFPPGGEVQLQWQAADLDNDIAGYEVFIDTVSPPAISAGTTTATSLEVVVAAATIYYWRIITHDTQGNSSYSEIFQFRTTD